MSTIEVMRKALEARPDYADARAALEALGVTDGGDRVPWFQRKRVQVSDGGGHLDGLLGEETEESETESETKSARELAELRAALDTGPAAR